MEAEMIRDGLYKVEFHTPLGAGAGVVHLLDGKLRGGDAGLFYTGSYATDGNNFMANVATDRHTQMPGIVSVFGIDRVHITLRGTYQGEVIDAAGVAAEAPNVPFKARLQRIGD
jgi:hypothetical protein